MTSMIIKTSKTLLSLICFVFFLPRFLCHADSRTQIATLEDIQVINSWSNETFERVNFSPLRKLQKTMRQWAGLHFGEPDVPVMYFFSGADLYTMMGLFPQAPAYALVAEFFPGNITCFRDVECRAIASRLAFAWYEHVEVRAFGYSVTASMTEFFAEPSGILPAILLILRIFNHIVIELETTERGFTITTNHAVVCYENLFITDERDLKHLLSLKSMPPKPWAIMFKAGAHNVARNPWFTNNILANSAMVVQDETGLRATAFQGNWTVKAYGQYHPFTGNGTRFVEDMLEFRALFHNQHSNQLSLPFCYGYCSEYHTRGMLIVAENRAITLIHD